MNLNYISKLPYLNTRDFDILLDTGSSINLISKDFVYKDKTRFKIFKEDFKFYTATGITRGNEYVILTVEKQKVKCYLCNFHYKFNVLLGHEALKQLKTSWIMEKDLVKMGNNMFKLQYLDGNETRTRDRENHNIEVQKVEIRSNHLNSQEKFELEKLLRKYNMLFPREGEILSHTTKIKHRINTTDEIPIYSRQYRYPYVYKEEIDNQVDDVLKKGIIQESHSPWSSPV